MLKEYGEHQPECVLAEFTQWIAKNINFKCRCSNSSSKIPFSDIFCFIFPCLFFPHKQEGKPNLDSSLLHLLFTPFVKFSLCQSIYLSSFSAEKPLSLWDFYIKVFFAFALMSVDFLSKCLICNFFLVVCRSRKRYALFVTFPSNLNPTSTPSNFRTNSLPRTQEDNNFVYLSLYMHTYIYIYIFICLCVYIYIYLYVCIFIYEPPISKRRQE